jgi:uncharacterized protein YecE (DUF72 family)
MKEAVRRGSYMLYLGCPVWSYKGWVGTFFPKHTSTSEFLRLYSQKLNCVEGNTTFYATPSPATIARWSQETPETFRFCPKVARSISHAARLDANTDELQAFVERMRGLGKRLGPLFLQLPPHFAPADLAQLQTVLDHWPQDIRLAVEVRHVGYYGAHEQALNALLTHYQVARVMMDTRPIRVGPPDEQQMLQARERKPDLPVHPTNTTDFIFLRYIGHPRMEVNEPFLDQWAPRLAGWYKQGITLYVFCHCPLEEHSPAICAQLYRRIHQFVPLTSLPWLIEQEQTQPEQGRLF